MIQGDGVRSWGWTAWCPTLISSSAMTELILEFNSSQARPDSVNPPYFLSPLSGTFDSFSNSYLFFPSYFIKGFHDLEVIFCWKSWDSKLRDWQNFNDSFEVVPVPRNMCWPLSHSSGFCWQASLGSASKTLWFWRYHVVIFFATDLHVNN